MILQFDIQQEIILDMLGNMHNALDDDTKMFKSIGEYLVATTQDRFRTSTAPDGRKWQENSMVTLLNSLKDYHFRKDGTVNKRGQHRLNTKKPLVSAGQAGGTLQDSIHYQLGNGEVFVGSNIVYAPMMHFGGKKSKYAHLWGDIPARPFLGLSLADEQEIAEIVKKHILR